MLELVNLNKYFNKGKKSEVHVINNTSLTFDNNGLVAFLGPSGCGKTTLLNTIGGLDKVKSGKILVNGKKMNSVSAYNADKIRNLQIGYIFQDYKLVDEMSVFDNVAIVLKMIGLKDKKEIKKRVEYVLDKVGMLRYKSRPANMLSGGERQRVGIARAIAKDPDIILADEPTGNLDSKNSVEIMNIIKAISKDKLVLLVTHERELANFYASRIIELVDGKVENDYVNEHNNELEYTIDNRFFLKDMKNHDALSDKISDINVYSENDEKIKLNIVVKNGNIYVQSAENVRVEVVDDNSSIEFVDDHYKALDKETLEKYEFHFKDIINNNFKKKYSNVVHILGMLGGGFKSLAKMPGLKKFLLAGFVLAAMFIVYGISTIAALYNVKDKDFIQYNKNYILVNANSYSVESYLSYREIPGVDYVMPGDSLVRLNLSYKGFYQTNQIVDELSACLSHASLLTESDLIAGRLPQSDNEVVVDKLSLTKLMNNTPTPKMCGVNNVEDFIGLTVKSSENDEYTIVGVADLESPSIYITDTAEVHMLYNMNSDISARPLKIGDYNEYADKFVLKEGRLPENDYETIVNISNKEEMKLNKEIKEQINGVNLTVVGYYTSREDLNIYLVNPNTIFYDLIVNSSMITLCANDKEAALEYLSANEINAQDTYAQSRQLYDDGRAEQVKTSLIASAIIIGISLVEIFLMIRSSFLSRVKEIGIYRAIGMKKSDIYRVFLGEIIAITTVTGIPGIIIMSYILYKMSMVKYIGSLFLMTPWIVILALVAIYVFNILVGMIPVISTVAKKPAAILARHDLD